MGRRTAHKLTVAATLAALALSACELLFDAGSTQPQSILCANAGADAAIDPSNYSHVCNTNSDCVPIAVGSGCDLNCPGVDAINIGDYEQYECDLHAVRASQGPLGPPGTTCPVLCDKVTVGGPVCCFSGVCEPYCAGDE